MAFTTPVNYTQNIPISLGYFNEVSGTSGTVTARISFNSKGGRLTTGVYGASTSFLFGNSKDQTFANTWEIIGTEADVNAALNDLSWLPKAYDDSASQQDYLSQDRAIEDYKGEVLVETRNRLGSAPLSIGNNIQLLSNGIARSDYTVSAVDTTSNSIKYYCTLDEDYDISDLTGRSPYTNVPVNAPFYTNNAFIDYTNDYAIVNPHGEYNLNVVILDNGIQVDSAVTPLSGVFFVLEPTFTSLPQSTIASNGAFTWSDALNMGQVSQPDNELISVQLLLKKNNNDPTYCGNVIHDSPCYMQDESYGVFSEVRVNTRISETYDSGVVRWSFYGTPSQCNEAITKVKFYTIKNEDFYIETRIVNGRSRQYSARGEGFDVATINALDIVEMNTQSCNFLVAQDCTSQSTYKVLYEDGVADKTFTWSSDIGTVLDGQGGPAAIISTTDNTTSVIEVTCSITDSTGTDSVSVSFQQIKQPVLPIQAVDIILISPAGSCVNDGISSCNAAATYEVSLQDGVGVGTIFQWSVDNINATIVSGQGTNQVEVSTEQNTTIDQVFNLTCVVSDESGTDNITKEFTHTSEIAQPIVITSIDEVVQGSCVYIQTTPCSADSIYNVIYTGGSSSIDFVWGTDNGNIVFGQGTDTIQVRKESIQSIETFNITVSLNDGLTNDSDLQTFTQTRTQSPVYEFISITETQAGSCSLVSGAGSCTATSQYIVEDDFTAGDEVYTWAVSIPEVVITEGQGTNAITVESTGSSNLSFELTCSVVGGNGNGSGIGNFVHQRTTTVDYTVIPQGLFSGANAIDDLFVLASNENGTIISGYQNGFASRSTDFGQTWAPLPIGLNVQGGAPINIHRYAFNTNQVMAVLNAGFVSTSSDTGSTWAEATSLPHSSLTINSNGIDVNPASGKWTTSNSFQTAISTNFGQNWATSQFHADIILYNGLTWVIAGGGSRNGAVSFDDFNSFARNHQDQSIDGDYNAETYMMITRSAISLSLDNGQVFDVVDNPLSTTNMNAIASDKLGEYMIVADNATIILTNDNGVSWVFFDDFTSQTGITDDLTFVQYCGDSKWIVGSSLGESVIINLAG